MNDFLTKPLVPEKIKEMLNKFLTKGEHPNKLINVDESENDLHVSYHELLNLFKNKSIVKEAFTIALKDLPAQLNELEIACSEKHPGKVNEIAHRLKGSSSSMRFGIMAKIADKIESESSDKWTNNIDLHYSELQAEWEIVKKIIKQKIN
jgi:HPt (histidine-containing phosphotransfer) domain-containing protein